MTSAAKRLQRLICVNNELTRLPRLRTQAVEAEVKVLIREARDEVLRQEQQPTEQPTGAQV